MFFERSQTIFHLFHRLVLICPNMQALKDLFPSKKCNYILPNHRKNVLASNYSQIRNEANHNSEAGLLTKPCVSDTSQKAFQIKESKAKQDSNSRSLGEIHNKLLHSELSDASHISPNPNETNNNCGRSDSDMEAGYDLKNWDLPPGLVRWYKKKGVDKLFDWQVSVIEPTNYSVSVY